MFLIDTNVWLERLLNKERSDEVKRLLALLPAHEVFITIFSFHSIGVISTALKELAVLQTFVQDAFLDGSVTILQLEPTDTERLIAVISQYGLDFDDAYQYVSAEKYNLRLVSLDKDFDRTPRGRETPAQVLASLRENESSGT